MKNRYPNRPGVKGNTATGREAAEQFAPKLGLRQREALDALAVGPLSADQIADQIGRNPFHTRPRISELKALGLAVETGERIPSGMGGNVHVVRLTTHQERSDYAARKALEDAKGATNG